MSNLNFAEFANTLQAAQAAVDNAPILQQALDNAYKQRDEAQRHSGALEEQLHNYKVNEANLHTRLTEVERERDTFRLASLDAAAKIDRLVSAVTSASDMVADEIRQVMPQSEPPAAQDHDASGHNPNVEPMPEPDHKPMEGFPGNPVPGTVPSVDPGPAIGSVHPYAGKAYHDHPLFVSYHAWLDGGGTDYGYNWRPNAPGDQPTQPRLSAQPEVLSDGKPQSESIGYGSDQKRYY